MTLAWTLAAVTGVAAVATGVLSVVNRNLAAVGTLRTATASDPASDIVYVVTLLAFASVGAIIVRGRPRNRVGWLFLAFGLLACAGALTGAAAFAWLVRDSDSALGLVAVWLGTWLWGVAFAAGALALLHFPDGRLPSRRWRVVQWIVLAGAAGLVAFGLLVWPYRGVALLDTTGDAALIGPAAAAVIPVASVVLFSGLLLCLLSLVVRFWRSHGVERLQLKWLTFAVVLAGVAGYGVDPLLELVLAADAPNVSEFLVAPLVLAVPVSIGIAVTRYGLYEIDRIISRTVSYALLTGVLVAVYALSVVALRAVIDPIVGDSDVAVAGSTLIVAAAFGPVRRRVQTVIDRRFNRRRYDAQRDAARFAQRLRGAVDLDEVAADLHATVTTTVQPAQMTVWLVSGRRAGA